MGLAQDAEQHGRPSFEQQQQHQLVCLNARAAHATMTAVGKALDTVLLLPGCDEALCSGKAEPRLCGAWFSHTPWRGGW
jgi:hypothetical protein